MFGYAAVYIDETMQKAGRRPEDVDVVFTAGRTSPIPCVKPPSSTFS
jgi:hypothetical protein